MSAIVFNRESDKIENEARATLSRLSVRWETTALPEGTQNEDNGNARRRERIMSKNVELRDRCMRVWSEQGTSRVQAVSEGFSE
jgi:hypothetical protein